VRVCPACGSARLRDDWTCDECGNQPGLLGGFRAFAPALATENEGFRPEIFADLADLEADNFWFRARNELIAWAIGTYARGCTSFLEVGCGTGFVLHRIQSDDPSIALTGAEIFSAGLAFAAERIPDATFYQMDARRIPFRSEFGAIGAFDVLEHVAEDETVIAQIALALQPGGILLATVPQHRALWSQQDVHAHHVRRYAARELRRKVEKAGFDVVRMTSFVSLLLPMMFASRMRMKAPDPSFNEIDALRLPGPVNAALELVMAVERAMIRGGVSFPAGGSLLLVARKPDEADSAA
jgi:SAM-dependent methyltransferase